MRVPRVKQEFEFSVEALIVVHAADAASATKKAHAAVKRGRIIAPDVVIKATSQISGPTPTGTTSPPMLRTSSSRATAPTIPIERRRKAVARKSAARKAAAARKR